MHRRNVQERVFVYALTHQCFCLLVYVSSNQSIDGWASSKEYPCQGSFVMEEMSAGSQQKTNELLTDRAINTQ